jgi:Bacterial capsule synthesis protein PGA_cap
MNTMTFLGDVFLPRAYAIDFDFEAPYVFNLEHPITSASVGWPNKVNLKADANYIPQTFKPLPTAVCLANNHIMDYGARGFDDTLEHLNTLGLRSFGAGRVENNASNPLVVDEHGVALLGYACPSTAAVFATSDHPGAARLDFERIVREIAAARRDGARRVVVSLHWGEEHVFLPKPGDVAMGRRIIDAGADLVIGHHAHCAQPFERYRGRFIFYGLGNCITPDIDQPSYFDESGRSTRRAMRKQHWWNRRSLAVDYDVESGNVRARVLEFDGKSLRILTPDADAYAISIGDETRYSASYRRSYTIGKLRNKVLTYVKMPRLPRPRHLKSIVAIAREVSRPPTENAR